MSITESIKVGIGDGKVAIAPESIMTIGLGSCVGVSFYDKYKKQVGLIHIMLPDSTQFKDISKPYKYADLAIPLILKELKCKGSIKNNLVCKVAGGASMFNFSDKRIISDVGKRNYEAVIKILNDEKIPIVAKDVGGNKGRTMSVDAETGLVNIKKIGSTTIIL